MSDKKPVIVEIDDEVDFTAMMVDYFEPRGYDISIANTGVMGIELIKNKKPDVIILDLKMPGINGDEVYALAKRMQPKVQIIFVTAYDDGGKTKARLLDGGAFACLDKPVPSLTVLEDTVVEAFTQAQL